ncbi:MAG: glycosyltransferase family 2 protein [Phycisphaerales bacterium]
MRISVLIPSIGPSGKLVRCLDALTAQTLPNERFEVLYTAADDVDVPERFRRIAAPTTNTAACRNALFAAARHELVLFLSPDVLPLPDCLDRHIQAHETITGKPALMMGGSPNVIRLPDRLLDRVARESSLIDSLDQMEKHGASVERDWTFRSTLFLNLSFRTQDAAGMIFDETPEHSEYSDLEWAWRVTSARSLPLVFRPQIRVRHDHRIEPDAFLAREFVRGTHAYHVGLRYPRFAKALFGREIGQADELRYSRTFVEAEREFAESLRQEFFALADVSAESVSAAAVGSIFHQQLLLKRWTWRLGLVAAAAAAIEKLPASLAA